MLENYKDVALDMITQLSHFIKNQPILSVDFDIIADNRNIEEFILSKVDRTDWEGRALSDDDIQELSYNALKRFYSSKGYNNCGHSTFTMRVTFIAQNIKYGDVYDIVSGNREDMPKDYKFLGNIRPSDFYNV